MRTCIDLNCDVGELDEIDDLDFIPYVSSINVCCGEHAGNSSKILKAIRAAKAHGVNIGAHPSYPDRINFGRKSMDLPLSELRACLHDQILYIKRLCDREGVALHHVKPHGTLYHDVWSMEDRLEILLGVMDEVESDLYLYGLSVAAYDNPLLSDNPYFIPEGFMDRRYRSDGRLVSRDVEGGVISDWASVVDQLDQLLAGVVETHDGSEVEVDCRSICIHSDTPHASSWIADIVHHLKQRGVRID